MERRETIIAYCHIVRHYDICETIKKHIINSGLVWTFAQRCTLVAWKTINIFRAVLTARKQIAHCSNVYLSSTVFLHIPCPRMFSSESNDFHLKNTHLPRPGVSRQAVLSLLWESLLVRRYLYMETDPEDYITNICFTSIRHHFKSTFYLFEIGTSPPICNNDIVYVWIHYLFYVNPYFSIKINFWRSASHKSYPVV